MGKIYHAKQNRFETAFYVASLRLQWLFKEMALYLDLLSIQKFKSKIVFTMMPPFQSVLIRR